MNDSDGVTGGGESGQAQADSGSSSSKDSRGNSRGGREFGIPIEFV